MKKLYGNIIRFMLPVLGVLLLLPVNKRMKYEGLENDCFNHAMWIHDRIHTNEKPVDIAFLGSSHTINGINDRLIEQHLAELGLNAVNFGYCRLGRNLSYVLLKEILAGKTPQYLVLEVREDENKQSHPIFPHMAGTVDVWLAYPFFNKDLLGDIWTHLAYKVDRTQGIIYNGKSKTPFRNQDFGFATSGDTATMALLDDARVRRSNPKKELAPLKQRYQLSYPRKYLRKVVRLCENNGMDIIFLYLPAYGTNQKMPGEYETYLKYGKVLIPPKEIFEDPSNWFDDHHFNQNGSDQFSLWLSAELMHLIKLN